MFSYVQAGPRNHCMVRFAHGCSVGPFMKYLSTTKQYRSACSNMVFSTTKKKRVLYLETSFRFGLDRSLVMFMGQALMMTVKQSRSRLTRFVRLVIIFHFQEKLCSPVSIEGRHLVIVDDIFSLLFKRCHPQFYGRLFHWPFGGSSGGCKTC